MLWQITERSCKHAKDHQEAASSYDDPVYARIDISLCIAYMIGDFQYGNCIAWISPDYENAFVAQEGPQPDN